MLLTSKTMSEKHVCNKTSQWEKQYKKAITINHKCTRLFVRVILIKKSKLHCCNLDYLLNIEFR